MKTFKYRIVSFIIVLSVFVLSMSIGHAVAEAATLSLSSNASNITPGQTFFVKVILNSPDQSANAVSATVSYPADKVQVVSVSKVESVLTLWAQDPTISYGAVHFEGITTSGFQGSGARIVTITFKTIQPGDVSLSLSSASVLANDGQGTNILTGVSGASITIQPQDTTHDVAPVDTQPVATPHPVSGTPGAPVIVSSTNQDPHRWYSNKSPQFSWAIPSGVTAIRIGYDKNLNGTPSVVYDINTTSKTLDPLADGQYYFHAQYKNTQGWGPVTTFAFSIDTVPPDPFTATASATSDPSVNQPVISASAHDSESGIDHFEITVDGMVVGSISPSKMPFTTSGLESGDKTISVKAVDGAGNSSESIVHFFIKTPPTQPSPLHTFSFKFVDISSSLVLIIAGILAIMGAFYYAYSRVRKLRRKVRRNLVNAIDVVHVEFGLIRNEIVNDLKLLAKTANKRELTKEELAIEQSLMKFLKAREKDVEKALERIQKYMDSK